MLLDDVDCYGFLCHWLRRREWGWGWYGTDEGVSLAAWLGLAMVDPRECRLWLPKQFCECIEVASALVGWVNVGPKSVDVVVVSACPLPHFHNTVRIQLQEVLDAAETTLPQRLRTERKLRVVGEYVPESASPDHTSDLSSGDEDDGNTGVKSMGRGASKNCVVKSWDTGGRENFQPGESNLGFHPTTSSSGIASDANFWAVVSAHRSSGKSNELHRIPYLRSVSFKRFPPFVKDHTIVYHRPVFGSHHFSSVPWNASYKQSSQSFSTQSSNIPLERPDWLTTLEQAEDTSDMEMVMVELNCSAFIDGVVKGVCYPAGSAEQQSMVSSICCQCLWCPIAAVVAVWATVLYALAHALVVVFAIWLRTFPYFGPLLKRSMTWQTMHIRCQQLMAWPFILLWGGLGPEQPNVAIAHKMAITRHSTWSVLLIDKIIGAITGFFLLRYHASITQFLVQTAQSFTNDVLRIGCVWLMGVPAGFKLNNELAETFGTLSLHLIQSWSTLLYTLMPAVEVCLHVVGISGFLLGFTVMAAMISDMIFLSTFHVSCLHHTIAFLHTNQLRALAALWRLFRGRKRNPLRRRLDTFDCTVEQLVVGSLMFTPILLLLPTTSVYYTFFAMNFWTLSSLQFILHYTIAIFHSFPFSMVATWMIQPKQFPSGVYFQSGSTFTKNKQRQPLLSTLGIQTAGIAELVKPFLRSVSVTLEWSSAASFAYKVVSGERYYLKLQLGIFASLPHIPISLSGFAWLCYMAVVNAPRSVLSK